MDKANGGGRPLRIPTALILLALLGLAGCSKWWSESGPVGLSAPETATYAASAAKLEIPVKIKNQSQEELSSAKDFFVSYHLLDANDAMVRYDTIRTPLPAMAPGQEVTVSMVVMRPEEPGVYHLSVDVVQENVAWMAQKGTKPVRIKLFVQER
jgi:hypothetical protein